MGLQRKWQQCLQWKFSVMPEEHTSTNSAGLLCWQLIHCSTPYPFLGIRQNDPTERRPRTASSRFSTFQCARTTPSAAVHTHHCKAGFRDLSQMELSASAESHGLSRVFSIFACVGVFNLISFCTLSWPSQAFPLSFGFQYTCKLHTYWWLLTSRKIIVTTKKTVEKQYKIFFFSLPTTEHWKASLLLYSPADPSLSVFDLGPSMKPAFRRAFTPYWIKGMADAAGLTYCTLYFLPEESDRQGMQFAFTFCSIY